MPAKTTTIHTLNDLIANMARDTLDAERQAAAALPKMAQAASSAELKQAFEKHIEETTHHVERVVQMLEKLGESTRAKTCHGMRGILKESQEQIDLNASPEMRDLALIAAARKIEHYEIASYDHLRHWVERANGGGELKSLVNETLKEETRFDEHLLKLAEKLIAAQHAVTA